MILQFLQIFFTDALTFMRSLQTSDRSRLSALVSPKRTLATFSVVSSAYLSTPAVITQVGFLHHALVLMAHGMRLHLRHEVHRYNDENE